MLLISLMNFAQDFNFKSYVDKNNISTDDYIRFIVESNQRIQLNNLTFKDFSIKQGPYTSSSSQTTIINGKFESKKEFKSTFILIPKKDGELVIEAIKVNYGGEEFTTDRIIINVTQGQNSAKNNSSNSNNSNNNEKLFARITCSKKNPLIGENIIVKYKIYQSVYHVRNIEITDYDLPMSNDFWTELIEPKNKQWKEDQEIINGIQYSVFTLKKEIISPQKTGKITIPAFEVSTLVNRDFFNRGVSKKLKSNTIKLNVKPLPKNAPKSFNGQIGSNYKLKVDVTKKELKVDDALDLSIEISGKGNLKQLSIPKINFPQDLEQYPQDIKSKINITSNGIFGSKKVSQLLIPRFHGDYEIPKIEFSYFDINLRKYKVLTHPAIKIKVNKNNGVNSSGYTSNYNKTDQKNVSVINENIHHIKTKTELYDFSNPIFGTPYYWSIVSAIPCALFLILFFIYNKDKFTDRDKVKMKKIINQVNESFKLAKNHLDDKENNSFYKEIYKLWTIYLSNKFKLEIAVLSKEKINASLIEAGIKEDDIKSLDKILNNCEIAQYSPLSSSDAQYSYDQSQLLFNQFEKDVV